MTGITYDAQTEQWAVSVYEHGEGEPAFSASFSTPTEAMHVLLRELARRLFVEAREMDEATRHFEEQVKAGQRAYRFSQQKQSGRLIRMLLPGKVGEQ